LWSPWSTWSTPIRTDPHFSKFYRKCGSGWIRVDQEDQGDHNPPWWTRSGFYILLMAYRITSQYLWTNCTTKQASSHTPTPDKCRCNRSRLQRRTEGSTGQPRRPTIPSGKGRPDRTTDHREDTQQGTPRSCPVGQYPERRSGVQKLRHHHEPTRQGIECQTANRKQRNMGKSFRRVLPNRRNNWHPKMG